MLPHRSKRTRSTHLSGDVSSFGASSTRPSQPLLVTATDICLWLTLTAVAIGFGGRMANGQLALIVGATATAFCWLLYQLTTKSPRYSWTGSEWLWVAGIFVGAAQIVPLPTELLLKISPHVAVVLITAYATVENAVEAFSFDPRKLRKRVNHLGVGAFFGNFFEDIQSTVSVFAVSTFDVETFESFDSAFTRLIQARETALKGSVGAVCLARLYGDVTPAGKHGRNDGEVNKIHRRATP